MKKLVCSFFMIFFFSFSILNAQNSKTAPLLKIMEKIDKSYQYAVNNISSDIELVDVTMSFTISSTTSKGGGINIWIFKLGRKTETKKLRTVTFKLEKKEKKETEAALADDNDELGNLIIAAAKDFHAMNGSNHLPSLEKRSFVIESGLTVTKDKSIGGEYTIGIFTLSAEGGRSNEQGHSIVLTFNKKS